MRAGPVAIVSPISAAHSAIPIVLAVIFLGERMNIGQSVGATAAVCGIVLAALDLRALKSGTSLVGKGTLLALAAMLTFGLVLYFLALLSRDLGWFIPAYVLRMMSVALVAPVSVARREPPWRGITSWVVAGIVLLGLFDIGGAFAFARGAEIGQISIVAAASSGYPLVAIGGGILLFRERLALSQIAGIVSILAGLVLLGLVS